jgi:hypothetical protein
LALHLTERAVSKEQGEVIARRFDHGQRLLDEGGERLDRTLRLAIYALDGDCEPCAEFAEPVARRGRPLGDRNRMS